MLSLLGFFWTFLKILQEDDERKNELISFPVSWRQIQLDSCRGRWRQKYFLLLWRGDISKIVSELIVFIKLKDDIQTWSFNNLSKRNLQSQTILKLCITWKIKKSLWPFHNLISENFANTMHLCINFAFWLVEMRLD